MAQLGGYDLYDFDVTLHAFGRKIWGSSDGQSSLDVSELVGKLLFNAWKLRLTFEKRGGSVSTEKAAVVFMVGAQGNT
jgi:hypothetical protein